MQQRQRRGELQAALAGEGGGLPVGAMRVAMAGKADADLVAAEDRIGAGRRVLLVDDLALPQAVGRRIGAEIIEERIAAEQPAVLQQHHSGEAARKPVTQPDPHRIQPVDRAAGADRAGRRHRLLVERRHHRAERGDLILRLAACEAIERTIGATAGDNAIVVGAVQRAEARIDGVALAGDPADDLVAVALIAADMGEGRIAAEQPALMDIHHAAANHVAGLVLDLVKPVKQPPAPKSDGATPLRRNVADRARRREGRC